jgi:serine protease
MHKTPSIIEEIIDPNDISSGHHITNRTLGEIVQHGIYQVQVDQVWDHVNSKPNKYRYTPIKVCIVDTGYDVSHEDLPNNAEGTDCGYGTPMRDGDGHGTHCAGVIGALGGNNLGISGVNPGGQVRFHISKALNDEGMGTASSVIRGIDACINSGARIISMSLGGGPGSKLMDGMFDRAYDKNIITFAASGNVGKDMHDYPASYPHAVSIGGVDKSGKRADFSNWSNQLELMGPGKSIISCYPRNKYATLSGTSSEYS